MIDFASLGPNFENVHHILSCYEEVFAAAETNLVLKGKTLREANREQCTWLSYYDQQQVELSIYVKLLTLETERIRGKLTKKYCEHYNKDLGERVISKYVDHEAEYIEAVKIQLMFEELRGKYASLVEAFTARGYSLKNLTDLTIAVMEESVI